MGSSNVSTPEITKTAAIEVRLPVTTEIPAKELVSDKDTALKVLAELLARKTAAEAAVEAAQEDMQKLVEKFGDDEKLDEVQEIVLKKFKVDVPAKKRLRDLNVNGLIYFTGLDPSLNEAKVLDYLNRHHKDKLEVLTTRKLNVKAFEAYVGNGDIKSETVAAYYDAPKPKPVCKVT